jgi:hypothetical protein
VTPRYCEADPFEGGKQAVAEAWRNITAVGGRPLAVTDNLNFGNPERPEIGFELAHAIDGIAAAANELGIPVVSGNVSLYNETGGRPIPPTPVVGCVGSSRRERTRRAGGARPRAAPRRGGGARRLRLAQCAVLRSRTTSPTAVRFRARGAAAWSGLDRVRDGSSPRGLAWAAVVACAPGETLGWPDLVELGTV